MIRNLRLSVVVEDSTSMEKPDLGAKHGLSLPVEAHARKLTGIDKVYAVIGGFHLEKAGDDRIVATVRELAGFNPRSLDHVTAPDLTPLGNLWTPLETVVAH